MQLVPRSNLEKVTDFTMLTRNFASLSVECFKKLKQEFRFLPYLGDYVLDEKKLRALVGRGFADTFKPYYLAKGGVMSGKQPTEEFKVKTVNQVSKAAWWQKLPTNLE